MTGVNPANRFQSTDSRPRTGGQDLILVIDLGSSSVRASAYGLNAERLEDSTAFRQTEQAVDGTFDPQRLTILTEEVIGECLASVRTLHPNAHFAGVAWTSFAMSWLGVDGTGSPVTPVYTYSDASSAPYANALREELSLQGKLEDTWQRTGTPIHTAYAPSQLLRLASEEPRRLSQVATWQTLASHLLSRWRGLSHSPISNSEAGWSGLLNRRRLSWDEELMQSIGVEAVTMPPVVDYANCASGLAAPWASNWPEIAHTPFFLAVGDGVGANLGSGCADNRRIALTIGTTGAMRVVFPVDPASDLPPHTPPGLWSYPIDSRRWLVGGSLTDGGSLYEWLREMLAAQDGGSLITEAAALVPDAHRLTILPFLRSERAPGWATDASLTISGITPATNRAHLVRAVFEAVAFRFGLIYDRLLPLLAPGSEVVASGGALQDNPLWRQILADVLQTPVHLVNVDEATSRGAAILALQALGLPQPPDPPTVHTSVPDAQAGPVYATALKRQQELYNRLLGSH